MVQLEVLLFSLFFVAKVLVSCNEESEIKSFEHVFDKLDPIDTIVENDSISLGGIGVITVLPSKLYLPSYASNKIYVVNSKNKHTQILNKNDELALRMPYQMLLATDRYYVNDRGNHRIKILDSNFNLLSNIGVMGQVDDMKFIRKKNGKYSILTHGVQKSGIDKRVALFRLSDLDFKSSKYFGEIPSSTKYYTWRICTDSVNNIYLINVIGSEVAVYSENGEPLRTIKLKSSNIGKLLQEKDLKGLNPIEISDYVKDKTYQLIQNINVIEDYLLVQYLISKPNNNNLKYLLDIFDRKGNILFSVNMKDKRIIDVKGNTMTVVQNQVIRGETLFYLNNYTFIVNDEDRL